MAAGLYGHCDIFTSVMDAAFGQLGAEGDAVRAQWLSAEPSEMLDDVTCAQPLLYALGYALGTLVESWGVQATALLGHSVGEMVAATMAGVFDFSDAMRIMRNRTDVFADTPAGGMLAVAASPDELGPYLSGQVTIAAINGPRQLLVAGPDGELDEAGRRLRSAGITCRRARARQAFHSPVVSAAVARSLGEWAATDLRAPRRTVYSAYLGTVLPPDKARDPEFWGRQPVRPVLFRPTLDRMLDDGDFLLVEAGPGQGLSALARRHPAVSSGRSEVVAMLPAEPGSAQDDRRAIAAARERVRALVPV